MLSTHSPAVVPQEFMVSTGLCVKVSLINEFQVFFIKFWGRGERRNITFVKHESKKNVIKIKHNLVINKNKLLQVP